MAVGLAYQVVKDIVALTKMEEAEPIDPGTPNLEELAALGIVDHGNDDTYRWSRPRNLFVRTEAPGASYEIVWLTDKLRRSKRKVVRFTHTGALDVVLTRRKVRTSQ